MSRCTNYKWQTLLYHLNSMLGKLACPRVNDDQKIGVDDQKLNSGRPHDD